MKRIRLSAAMSLDGFIAGPNGEHDWIVTDPDIDFGALMGAFDTVLLGRKTYEAMRRRGEPGMPGMQTYVFPTRSPSGVFRRAGCRSGRRST